MKSLTPQTLIECAARYNAPVLLLEVEWSGSLTGHYAQRPVAIGGTSYLGIIQKVGRIACSFRNPAAEYEPVTVALAPEETLLRQVTESVPEGKHARVKLFFEGLTAADCVELFSGHIEKVVLGDDSIELTLATQFIKHDRLLPELILSTADFPDAHVDDIGRALPLIYGQIPLAPTLKAKVGHLTHLHGSLLATDTTIEVDDASEFPETGTLLIEDEQITYTGRSGGVFTGCSRGANGTTAAEHLNRTEVIEHMTEHIYLVAGHACKSVSDVRVSGAPAEPSSCVIDCNNTSLLAGRALTTITFPDRPKVRRYSRASRFLEMQFDETAAGNEALDPDHCYHTSLEGFPTLVARISRNAANDTLRVQQTTDMSASTSSRGEILKAFLLVEHFESKTFIDDYLSVSVAGQTYMLAKPGTEDVAGGGGEVDIDHGHTHSITGEHTHSMTVKKEPLFTNVVAQTGGTTGGWNELEDVAGSNLNRSGYTTTPTTDRNLVCKLAATTAKGSVQRIQFCCRRGESGMAGSFVLRFYHNGSLTRQYTVNGTTVPETWKSGWEELSGVVWDDLDNDNTYITITPLATGLIRLFGVWYELEYLEQPDEYQGSGTKDSADVDPYSAANHHVINEEPISSTSIVEAIDITDHVACDWGWFTGREISIDYNVIGADDGVLGYILHAFFEVEYAPVEEVISDEVTCSVEGTETAGDGSGDLIENPADVLKHILVDFAGFDEAADIDAASFASARASLVAEGTTFAFLLSERMQMSKLLYALARQARLRLAFNDTFQLSYREDVLEEAVRTVGPPSIVSGSARLVHAGSGEIKNELIGYYARGYTRQGSLADRYRRVLKATNSSSQALYGIRAKVLELFAFREAAPVQTLLDFFLDRDSAPLRRYRWSSFLRDLNLERGDVVEITDLEKGLLKVKGEIVEAAFLPGHMEELRERMDNPAGLDTLEFAAEIEPYEYYWTGAGGTFIVADEQNFYFVVRGVLAARLSAEGNFSIKGFVVSDQTLAVADSSPLAFDGEREAIAFSLPDGTRVMEIDRNGNVLLPGTALSDQTLPFSGTPDAIEANTSSVWANIGSARVLHLDETGNLQVLGSIFTDAKWEELYG